MAISSPLLPLLSLLLLLLGISIVAGREEMTVDRIKEYLRDINKPPLLTITDSANGDIIDCIDIKKQPAFDNPLLRDHKIQRIPTEWPKGNNYDPRTGKGAGNGVGINWQGWNGTRKECPAETVPIRRTSVEDVQRAESLHRFGKKNHPPPLPHAHHGFTTGADSVAASPYEYALGLINRHDGIYGTKATINVWDPLVENGSNEFSISQIWIMGNSSTNTNHTSIDTVEAGWQVEPRLYGDNKVRLFNYWTSDINGTTGCYNLICAGFVQTSSKVVVGGVISPLSSISSKQYEITILIWKDPKHGNWWMGFGDGETVGYWPKELFTNLGVGAGTTVQWGGEVVNSKRGGHHTTTQMGSGRFAAEGFKKASFFRNLKLVDYHNTFSPDDDIIPVVSYPNCYDMKLLYNKPWGAHFFYGGPGRGPACP